MPVNVGTIGTVGTSLTTTVATTTSSSQQSIIIPSPQTNINVVGNQQTDVTLLPYIKKQQIAFRAVNMRPGVVVHVFFDSVLIDEHCAPGRLNVAAEVDIVAAYANNVVQIGPRGTPITVAADGTVHGIFYVPEATFKVGDRVLDICDSLNIATGSASITTLGSNRYTCSYIPVTNVYPTPATVNPWYSCLDIVNTVSTSLSTSVDNSTWGSNANYNAVNSFFSSGYIDPFAQVFAVTTPHGEPGMFLTQIDLYFYRKSNIPANGVTVYLCETTPQQTGSLTGDAAYMPDTTVILPYSMTHLTNAQITADTFGRYATSFVFQSPVYVSNGKCYAIVIRPDGGDPNHQLFTCVEGYQQITTTYLPPNGTSRYTGSSGTVLSYNQAVIQQPVGVWGGWIGSTTQRWCPLSSEYFKFTLYRAEFTQSSGTAAFVNDACEYLPALNFTWYNDTEIDPGDWVFWAANSYVDSISAAVNTSIHGVCTYHDYVKGVLYLNQSTGNFIANCYVQVHRFANGSTTTCNSSTIIASGYTYPFYHPGVDGIVGQFSAVAPGGTNVTYGYRGTSNSFVIDTTTQTIQAGVETMFNDYQRVVVSRSTEVASMTQKSMVLYANMVTDSSIISPSLDLTKTSPLVIRNNIDPIGTIYDEFFSSGFSRSKYISNVITLAEGQDSEDLNVIVSAYRPPGTDVQVWVRFLNSADPDPISLKTWTPMRNLNSTYYCNPADTDDFENFTFGVPYQYPLLPTSGVVSCNGTSVNVSGANTLFGTESLTGWYINMINANTSYQEVSHRIVSVINSTAITIDSPFIGTYTGQPYFIAPPPTAAFMSSNTTFLLQGTVQTANNVLVGTNTNFTSALTAGSTIQIGNQIESVVTVSNNTYLTVGNVWQNQGTGLSCYNVVPAGLTYINSNYAFFSTFIAIQVKVIMQSNDHSTAPRISTVTATALTL